MSIADSSATPFRRSSRGYAADAYWIASRLVMAGVPLAAVMELLGHTTIAMTMRYAHLAPGHQRANVERLMQFAAPEKGASEVVKMPATAVGVVVNPHIYIARGPAVRTLSLSPH